MSRNDLSERYGLRPIKVCRSSHPGFPDEPPTEEQKRQDQDVQRNARLHEEYNELRQRLVNILDDKVFIAESLGFVTSQVTGEKVHSPRHRLAYENADDMLQLSERKRNIQTRLLDASLTLTMDLKTLKTLNTVLLSQNSRELDNPERNTPDIFYRAFRPKSYSRHDKDLGFRSSRQPLTLPSYHKGTLSESSLVDKEALRNHCEGERPSDLIAMSDSPARIFRILQGWDYDDKRGDMIAVINVSKLLAMNVLFNRTTTLAEKLAVDTWTQTRRKGLNWANPNYWVAYRWVPAECIEFYISVASLRRACEEHGIGELDHDQRLSLRELLSIQMEKLSL